MPEIRLTRSNAETPSLGIDPGPGVCRSDQTCKPVTRPQKQFHPRIQLILKKSRLLRKSLTHSFPRVPPQKLAQCGSNVFKPSPGIFSDRKYGSQQTTGRWLLHFLCKVTCKPNTPRQSPLSAEDELETIGDVC